MKHPLPKAAQALRIDANQQTPQAEARPGTVAALVAHYRLKELAGERNGRKAFATRAAYECYLDSWVLPKGTKAKIRNLTSALFSDAMRYEWLDRNPMKLVRQSESEFPMFWNLPKFNKSG